MSRQGQLLFPAFHETINQESDMENEENNANPVEVVPAPVAEPAPTSDACDRLNTAREFAREQYDKLRRATSSQIDNVRHYTSEARRQINDGWDVTCAKAKDWHKAGEQYVKSNPTGTVLGALGVGLLVGLLLGRRD